MASSDVLVWAAIIEYIRLGGLNKILFFTFLEAGSLRSES